VWRAGRGCRSSAEDLGLDVFLLDDAGRIRVAYQFIER